MSDHKAAYASLTFKKDKYAWGILTLLILGFIWKTGGFGEVDSVALRPWKGLVSNQATLTVLEFDRVVWKENEGHVHEDQLRQHLKAFNEDGFEAVSIEDVFKFYYEDGKLPEKSILLIFANGYLETYSVVDPVLREMQWPAMIALITDPIVRRETFFLYWDRLQRMVASGIWGIISAGHRSREGGTNARRLIDRFFTFRVGITKGEREAGAHENPVSVFQDYQVSRDLIEEYISGYKTLAYSHRYFKDANSGYSDSASLKRLFELGFVDSFVGVNDQNSDPHRLRRLRVQPDWQPETLLAWMNKAIHVTAASDEKRTHEDSAWFNRKGELVETAGHANILSEKILSSAHNQRVNAETYLHGTPGSAIFIPGGNRAGNWVLDVNFRLDRGEFWIRQDSFEQGDEWRLGGNENQLNLQYRVGHGKYENLARSRAGVPLKVWQHVRLIKRGKGIIANLNGERLWDLPIHLQSDLKGDIALQVWSGDGEGALTLSNTKVSFFSDDIRWLEKYPQEADVQRLIQDAEQVAGVTTVTHVVQGNQLKPIPFDKDLFQIISHRYGWDFIPTISLLLEKKTSIKYGDGSSNYLWMSEIQTLVKQNKWTHVHLDLSNKTPAMKPEGFASLAELKLQLGNLGCLLLLTTGGRPDVRQSIESQQILKNIINGVTLPDVRVNTL